MIVGVMASGSNKFTEEDKRLAKYVAKVIAEEGYDLLTGGGGGLMKVVGKAFCSVEKRRGKLINIIRAKGVEHLTSPWSEDGEYMKKQRDGPENPNHIRERIWSEQVDNELGEITIKTHLPFSGDLGAHDLSRNHINVLTADKIVVLPGGLGTLSELKLALEYQKPVTLLLGTGGKVHDLDAAALQQKYGMLAVCSSRDKIATCLKSQRRIIL